MDRVSIDASVGLGFSLGLFKRYKSTGILQATLRRFPGLQGPHVVNLYLVEGAVVSCSMEDKNGQHTPILKDVLLRLDRAKGPFEWVFHYTSIAPLAPIASSLPAQEARFQQTEGFSRLSNAAVSRIASSLPGERLLGLPIQQRRMFLLVWQQIDGKQTVQEIKTALGRSLPASTVERILQVLQKLSLVVLHA